MLQQLSLGILRVSFNTVKFKLNISDKLQKNFMQQIDKNCN